MAMYQANAPVFTSGIFLNTYLSAQYLAQTICKT